MELKQIALVRKELKLISKLNFIFLSSVLIVPFMELKLICCRRRGTTATSLNRTFYGIETMEIGERKRSPHRVLIVPFMELKLNDLGDKPSDNMS